MRETKQHTQTQNPNTVQAGGTEDRKCYIPEKRAQRMELCYEENREGSLCPWSVDSQELLRKAKTYQSRSKKFWQSTHAQVQRRGRSVQQKKPPGSGFTFSWSWLGLSTLWSFARARVCAASIWQVKQKKTPSLVITILTTQRALSKQPTSQAWQTGMWNFTEERILVA